MTYKDIDLANPKLGAQLLTDPKGDLPLDVWEAYCRKPFAHLGPLYLLPVLSWRIDPSDPKTGPLDPQYAVDEAFSEAVATLLQLKSKKYPEALECAQRTVNLLHRGSSTLQPKPGQPASMRRDAIRAYIIRKFNPDPNKPKESSVRWSKLANLLLNENGKCPTCREVRHQYDSPCVKALMTAERRLRAAMEHDGIPT